MNVRWIVLGHIRGLRQRWSRTLLAVIAVGAGSSMVVGVVIAKHSLDTSIAAFGDRLTGNATLRVQGAGDHGGLDASVLPRVRAVPGVAAAVPLVVTITQVADSRGRESLIPALGVDCSAQALVGSFDCTPEMIGALGDNPVVSPILQKKLGAKGVVRTDLGELPTANVFALDQLNRINGGLVALFELGASQRQFVRPNGLDQILVVPAKGTDPVALRAAVTEAAGKNNHVVDANAPIGSSIVATLLLPFLFLISLIGLVIGAQLVRNTLELSLEERRRELATTAALGATPRDVMTGLMTEGVIIGLLGGAVAIGAGVLVARAFVGSLSAELAKATGLTIPVSTPPFAVVVCALVGVGVSVLASIRPARRAANLDLVAELSDRTRFEAVRTGSNRRLAITGVLAVAAVAGGWFGKAGGSLQTWQPPVAIVALVVSSIIAYVASAQITPRLLAALRRAPGFGTGPMRVALSNVLGSPRRTAAITIAIAAPVYVSVVLGGISPGIGAGAKELAIAGTAGHVLVSTLDVNNTAGVDAKVTPDLQRRLAALPGVSRLEPNYFVGYDHEVYALNAIDGDAPTYRVYKGLSGPEALAQGKVMLGPALARRNSFGPNDSITVPGRFGFKTYVVGGVWASSESLGFSITMRGDQMRELVGERPPDNIHVLPTPGTTPAELARSIRAAHLDPRLRVFDPDELGREMKRAFGDITAPFRSLQKAMIIVALIATASTLVLAAAQRRRDNAVLAAIGMSPVDLARATVVETGLIAMAATVTTAVTSQLMLLSFTWSSGVVSGMEIPYRIDVTTIGIAAVVVAFIAVVGATIPAWRTARTNVIAALRAA
ncbi:MAG: putative transport system permease protein [Actinomycetota bacterium]